MKRGGYIRGIVLIIAVLLYAQNISAWWHLGVFRTDVPLYPDGGWGLSPRSIAIDNNGTIHIIYNDPFNRIIHSYKDNLIWHNEIVENGPREGWSLGYPHPYMALDSDNRIHIIYQASMWTDSYQKLEVGIFYTTNSSGDWVTEEVVSATDGKRQSFEHSEVAVDSNNNPHISYVVREDVGEYPLNDHYEHLYYANKDNTGWHSEVRSQEAGGYYTISRPTMDVDSSGNPHILYKNGDWKYTYKDSTGWHVEIIDGSPNLSTATMVLDTNDEPHIIHDADYLSYTYKDSAGWHNEVLDESGICEWDSIALDANDNPHTSYFCLDHHDYWWSRSDIEYVVKYAVRVDAQWHLEVVDRAQTFSIGLLYPFWVKFFGKALREETSIAVDANGEPHLVYRKNPVNRRVFYDYGDFPASGKINNWVHATRCGSLD